MRKIIFIACLFLTFSVFSQVEDKTVRINIPTSIFSNYTFDTLQFNNQENVNSLYLINWL